MQAPLRVVQVKKRTKKILQHVPDSHPIYIFIIYSSNLNASSGVKVIRAPFAMQGEGLHDHPMSCLASTFGGVFVKFCFARFISFNLTSGFPCLQFIAVQTTHLSSMSFHMQNNTDQHCMFETTNLTASACDSQSAMKIIQYGWNMMEQKILLADSEHDASGNSSTCC